MAKFKKGNPGKPKGAVNKLTKTVREHVLDVFNQLQADDKSNLLAWAKKHPGDFYKIAAKLIPADINADLTSGGEKLQPVIIDWPASNEK